MFLRNVAITDESTRRENPEQQHYHLRENLRPCMKPFYPKGFFVAENRVKWKDHLLQELRAAEVLYYTLQP
jgi:hypothetical protein